MFKTIIWASDCSWPARHARHVAEGLARSNDAKLIVAYAEEGGLIGRVFAEHGESTPPHMLRETVDELKRAGIDAELVVRQSGKGGEAKAIADLARETGADLIVAGNAGHGATTGSILGSVIGRLLHVAPCPVLTVPVKD